MFSENPVPDIAEGATKAIINLGTEKLDQLIKKFVNRDLVFIEDEETIEIVKKQALRPEWKILKKYVRDPDLKLQIQMGFSLKCLEEDRQKTQDLRDKILRKYGRRGLHVAELVQNDILPRYVFLLIGESATDKDLEKRLEEILKDVEKYVLFIKTDDTAKNLESELLAKIYANNPNAIIVFSIGKNCTKKATKLIESTKKKIRGYSFERQLVPESLKQYDFVVKSRD